jgi:hypothetical protein
MGERRADQSSRTKLESRKVGIGSENGSENGGANWSAVRKAIQYLIDSKRCFGIIRAALSLLKSVDDFPHNPKVAGSNPAPATNNINHLRGPLGTLRAQ